MLAEGNEGEGRRVTSRKALPAGYCAWILPVLLCLAVNFTYMTLSYFPNQEYLLWAENRTGCREHLPDIFLDMHGMNEANWVTIMSDLASALPLVVAGLLCVVKKDALWWARMFNIQSFMMVFNTIAEQVTVMPSSYGYGRCLTYLGISGPAENTFNINPTGSCAAMLWSGHTFHCMLGVYVLSQVLEEHYDGNQWWSKHPCGLAGPSVRTLMTVFSGIVLGSMLLANKGHYTVDIFLAMFIGTLALTNEALMRRIDNLVGVEARCCQAKGDESDDESEDGDHEPMHEDEDEN